MHLNRTRISPHTPEIVLSSVFKKYDVDNSGALDEYEFANVLEELGVIDSVEQSALFALADSDNNKEIDWDEFLKLIRSHDFEHLINSSDDYQFIIDTYKAFQQYDEDGDGEITWEEFYKYLSLRGYSHENISKYWYFMDEDNNQTISFEEFWIGFKRQAQQQRDLDLAAKAEYEMKEREKENREHRKKKSRYKQMRRRLTTGNIKQNINQAISKNMNKKFTDIDLNSMTPSGSPAGTPVSNSSTFSLSPFIPMEYHEYEFPETPEDISWRNSDCNNLLRIVKAKLKKTNFCEPACSPFLKEMKSADNLLTMERVKIFDRSRSCSESSDSVNSMCSSISAISCMSMMISDEVTESDSSGSLSLDSVDSEEDEKECPASSLVYSASHNPQRNVSKSSDDSHSMRSRAKSTKTLGLIKSRSTHLSVQSALNYDYRSQLLRLSLQNELERKKKQKLEKKQIQIELKERQLKQDSLSNVMFSSMKSDDSFSKELAEIRLQLGPLEDEEEECNLLTLESTSSNRSLRKVRFSDEKEEKKSVSISLEMVFADIIESVNNVNIVNAGKKVGKNDDKNVDKKVGKKVGKNDENDGEKVNEKVGKKVDEKVGKIDGENDDKKIDEPMIFSKAVSLNKKDKNFYVKSNFDDYEPLSVIIPIVFKKSLSVPMGVVSATVPSNEEIQQIKSKIMVKEVKYMAKEIKEEEEEEIEPIPNEIKMKSKSIPIYSPSKTIDTSIIDVYVNKNIKKKKKRKKKKIPIKRHSFNVSYSSSAKKYKTPTNQSRSRNSSPKTRKFRKAVSLTEKTPKLEKKKKRKNVPPSYATYAASKTIGPQRKKYTRAKSVRVRKQKVKPIKYTKSHEIITNKKHIPSTTIITKYKLKERPISKSKQRETRHRMKKMKKRKERKESRKRFNNGKESDSLLMFTNPAVRRKYSVIGDEKKFNRNAGGKISNRLRTGTMMKAHEVVRKWNLRGRGRSTAVTNAKTEKKVGRKLLARVKNRFMQAKRTKKISNDQSKKTLKRTMVNKKTKLKKKLKEMDDKIEVDVVVVKELESNLNDRSVRVGKKNRRSVKKKSGRKNSSGKKNKQRKLSL